MVAEPELPVPAPQLCSAPGSAAWAAGEGPEPRGNAVVLRGLQGLWDIG